jgi:hypothetical protein
MADDKQEQQPTQLTQPKGIDPKTGKLYEPVEIPVPKRRDIEDLLSRAVQPLSRSPVADQPEDDGQSSEDH